MEAVEREDAARDEFARDGPRMEGCPVFDVESLFRACESDVDVGELRDIIEGGVDVNARRATDGSTALMVATVRGNVDVVRLLVDRGANVNDACDRGTALMRACERGNGDVVRLLVDSFQ